MAIFKRNSGAFDAFWDTLPTDFKRLFEIEYGPWTRFNDDNAKKAALTVFFDEIEKHRDRMWAQEQMAEVLRQFGELHERSMTAVRSEIRHSVGAIHERVSDVREVALAAVQMSARNVSESAGASEQRQLPAVGSPAPVQATPSVTVLTPVISRGGCQYPTTKQKPKDCIRYETTAGRTQARCEVADQVRANRKTWHWLTSVYDKTGCPSDPTWPKCPFIKNEWVQQ